MPDMIKLRRHYPVWASEQSDVAEEAAPVATADELLAFANVLRAAGNANALDALIPSEPKAANACLIANACNFSSSVGMHVNPADDSKTLEGVWKMRFPKNMDHAVIEAVGLAAGCEVDLRGKDEYTLSTMTLPRHIGNAAHAFDTGQAFRHLVAVEEAEEG